MHIAARLTLATALVFAASAASADTISIEIKGFKFNPPDAKAKVGDTIEWKNLDSAPHTATAGDGTFDLTIAPGGTGSFTPTAAGAFAYICMFHRSMKGTLTVAE